MMFVNNIFNSIASAVGMPEKQLQLRNATLGLGAICMIGAGLLDLFCGQERSLGRASIQFSMGATFGLYSSIISGWLTREVVPANIQERAYKTLSEYRHYFY